MVSVIIIDKDFTEWEILKVEICNATILFCQFHLIRCLFKKLYNFKIPKDDQNEVKRYNILCQLVHTSDESVYSSLKEGLFQIVCEDLKVYFKKLGFLSEHVGVL